MNMSQIHEVLSHSMISNSLLHHLSCIKVKMIIKTDKWYNLMLKQIIQNIITTFKTDIFDGLIIRTTKYIFLQLNFLTNKWPIQFASYHHHIL